MHICQFEGPDKIVLSGAPAKSVILLGLPLLTCACVFPMETALPGLDS